MEPKFLLLVGFLVLLMPPAYASGDKKSYGDIEGVIYLSNYDGDTIRFNIPKTHPLFG
jgi:hypothetical protein